MAIRDDTNKTGVVKLGVESDGAFSKRLLPSLGSKKRILVLNDEGHHCYRPRSKQSDEDAPDKEEKEENERAAQWITGLEKIHAARGILTCIDLSATPFYIHGSGYPVGRPFPWVVSDFGLVDAIESGLVKIPQIPVDDSLGGKPPAYFHLWRWINEKLPAKERETNKRKAKPEAVVREAEPAIVTMIGNWLQEFEEWRKSGSPVPPAMIVVTQDTNLSKLLFERLSREDFEFQEFRNSPGREVTYLYDSKEIKSSEEGKSAKEAELRKRAVMNTVGKEGEPGEKVRCIVSVSMLTEGWDANNVTQIVGLRAFTSQLLCEQVVGRALRRRSYDVNPETGFLQPEYADVYGVPFQVIPVKAKGKGGGKGPPPTNLIRALPDRAHMEIEFPRVEGYVSGSGDSVVCDWESVPTLLVGSDDPVETTVKGVVGFRIGTPDIGGPGAPETHTRVPYYLLARVPSACFRMASTIVANRVPGQSDSDVAKRAGLFPQVLAIVKRYVDQHLVFQDVPTEEVTFERWHEKIVNVLEANLSPPGDDGEPTYLPRIERFRALGTSREVFFRTGRQVQETVKSHVSHVVLDSGWEGKATSVMEGSEAVECYVRNDHLDFDMPYVDGAGYSHVHRPDFVVRLANGLHVALEIKGEVRETDELKFKAGRRWASAVNRWYGERRWAYHVCFDPATLAAELAALAGSGGPG